MNVGEFFITLGVNPETAKVKDFVKAVAELPVEAAGALVALGGISLEFKRIAEESINAAVGFEAFTNQTGLSSQELQKWEIVAEQANVSAGSVASSVSALQRQMAEIRMGRGDISSFQLLGINVNGNAFQVLDQLRERLKGIDRATATNLIGRMGLTPDMMNVLTLPEAQFRHFSQTVRGQTEEQTKTFLQGKLALTQFSLAVKELGMNFFYNMIVIIQDVVEWFDKFQSGLLVLAGIITAVVIAVSPLTAALTLLALIIEDIAVYFMGGQSLTGDFIEGLKTIFDDPIASAKVFLDLIDQLITKLTGGEGIRRAVGQFMNLPTDVMEAITSGDTSGLREDLFGTASAGRYGAVPAMAGAGAGGSRSVSVQQKVDIRIDGAQSPKDTAEAVDRHLKSQVNEATLQLDNQGH